MKHWSINLCNLESRVCCSDSGRPSRPGLLLWPGGLSRGAEHWRHSSETPEQKRHRPRPYRTVQHLWGQEAHTNHYCVLLQWDLVHWFLKQAKVYPDCDWILNFNAFLIQMTLRHEDGDDETQLPPNGRKDRRRASVGCTNERRGQDRRRSRRHSLQNSRDHTSASASPNSPHVHSSSFLSAGGQRDEDIRWGKRSKKERRGRFFEKNVSSARLHVGLNFIWLWFYEVTWRSHPLPAG